MIKPHTLGAVDTKEVVIPAGDGAGVRTAACLRLVMTPEPLKPQPRGPAEEGALVSIVQGSGTVVRTRCHSRPLTGALP